MVVDRIELMRAWSWGLREIEWCKETDHRMLMENPQPSEAVKQHGAQVRREISKLLAGYEQYIVGVVQECMSQAYK